MLNYINPKDIPKEAGKRSAPWITRVREFVASGEQAAEYVLNGESWVNAYNGLAQANKRLGKPCAVVMRNHRIYLVRREKKDA